MGALAVAVLAAPAAAHADPPPPPAAINQYVETIPTGSGGSAVGATKKAVKPLQSKAKRRLRKQGGSDAALLEKIATSSDYGAPQQSLQSSAPVIARPNARKPGSSSKPKHLERLPKDHPERDARKPALAQTQSHGTLAAGFHAAKSDNNVVFLVLLLVGSTIAVIGIGAVAKSRR